MIYPRDSFERERRQGRLGLILLLPVLALGFFFLLPSAVSKATGMVLRAASYVVNGKDAALGNTATIFGLFRNKEVLLKENERLSLELESRADREAALTEKDEEIARLTELLGRKSNKSRLLGAVLGRADQSPYDTLLVDVGIASDVKPESRAFTLDGILVGDVEIVTGNIARVSLFSSPGKEFKARINGISPITVIGRGGGSFEAVVPQGLGIKKGDEVTIPSFNRLTLGFVEEVLADARNPLEMLLILSPVAPDSIEWMEIEH